MKQLEKKYAKTERIVAKAKFSYWSLIYDVIFGGVLGGLVAVLWIFAPQIEGFFTKVATVQYLTETNLKWALLGVGLLFLLVISLHAYSIFRHELIVTEKNMVYKFGIATVKNNIIPLDEIKIVESSKNAIQQIINVGNVIIVSDAEKPIIIKSVIRPEPFARKAIKQSSVVKAESKEKLFQIKLAPTQK